MVFFVENTTYLLKSGFSCTLPRFVHFRRQFLQRCLQRSFALDLFVELRVHGPHHSQLLAQVVDFARQRILLRLFGLLFDHQLLLEEVHLRLAFLVRRFLGHLVTSERRSVSQRKDCYQIPANISMKILWPQSNLRADSIRRTGALAHYPVG